ncbi:MULTISPECIES: capsule biosynthesis protein CapE [unclassified Bacillus cereus group]|uniref:capsule biosynthesis protein CapE n=1 Tax=Bacillus cereus group TaxID=86661 RepID=UPI001F58801D
MAKSVFGWIMPILIVGALLVTLGTFKRSQTLTTDEQKKLNDYQQTNLKYIK